MPRKIGLIGLGIMGRGMALNLLKKGAELTVFNRTRAKCDEFAAQGAHVARNPREVAERSEAVITVLADPQSVEQVVYDENGVISGAHPGMIFIDSSTVSPATSRKLAAAFKERGVPMLDAPVLGSKLHAESGELIFLVGGPREVYESCKDILELMGKKLIYIGENGLGSAAKLANNLVAAITLQATCEGLVFATKAGIKPEVMLQVLLSGGARSAMAEIKGPMILKRDFEPHFYLKLMHKDLGLALATADELDVSLPVTAIVGEIFGAAKAKGKADYDFSAVITLLEEMAGVEVKS